jgi:hypothetical protein
MPFSSEHYNARASELETAAAQIGDSEIRASYLELAQRFRELAESAIGSERQQLEDELERSVEELIGKRRIW